MKRLLGLLLILVAILYIGGRYNIIDVPSNFSFIQAPKGPLEPLSRTTLKVTDEDSAVVSAIEKALPSVVTIGIKKTTKTPSSIRINPLDPFAPFQEVPGQEKDVESDIGSGFVIHSNGLIVTNKHVVADTAAEYKVVTNDGKEYKVDSISRDPLNDLAILHIKTTGLKALDMGDSSKLKLGQTVVAIGTPLGEFRNSVTKGIVSGLSRGITAGSPYEQFVERLDNVIQTDTAINPGNSGGPLINLAGQVIGVNVAVSQQGQNIGFAIPISVLQDVLKNNTNASGKIERPYLGVRYQMISRKNAVLNEVPEGAYVVEVIQGSGAEKAGIQAGDIILEFDGTRVKGDSDLTIQKLLQNKKSGASVTVKIWRDGKEQTKNVSLGIFE